MPSNVLERNNVNISGSGGSTIIFAHGFGCDQNMWRFVAPLFETTHRVVLFDYVGSGKSDTRAYDPVRYGDLEGYATDVLEICQALDIHDAIFIGHSVSSMIGMLASIREPGRFKRLVLIGPSPCYLNDPPDYYGGFERQDLEGFMELMNHNFAGWAGYLAPIIMQNADRPSLTTELEESFCTVHPDIARRFAVATFFTDYRPYVPLVNAPSLILQCADDFIAPVRVGQYLHSHLPDSRLHYMRATGHCPHMSHPEETYQTIREYLNEAFERVEAAG